MARRRVGSQSGVPGGLLSGRGRRVQPWLRRRRRPTAEPRSVRHPLASTTGDAAGEDPSTRRPRRGGTSRPVSRRSGIRRRWEEGIVATTSPMRFPQATTTTTSSCAFRATRFGSAVFPHRGDRRCGPCPHGRWRTPCRSGAARSGRARGELPARGGAAQGRRGLGRRRGSWPRRDHAEPVPGLEPSPRRPARARGRIGAAHRAPATITGERAIGRIVGTQARWLAATESTASPTPVAVSSRRTSFSGGQVVPGRVLDCEALGHGLGRP
jgi:hypothetical protein